MNASDPDCGTPAVHTVGHSYHDWSAFLALLRRYGIGVVTDVRSVPWSRRFPQFRKPALESALAEAGIAYLFLGHELGARRAEPECMVDGRVDYERLAAVASFRAGVDRVLREAGRRRLALLCAERDPLDCHRAILVGRRLAERGAVVTHILADGRTETHAELEHRLLRRCGSGPDLFAGELETAYRRRGAELAWRPPADRGAGQ